MNGIFRNVIGCLQVNSSRRYLQSFLRDAASSIQSDGYVLDAGAGDAKYQSLFAHCNYHATDIRQIKPNAEELSFVSNIVSVPIKGNQYDLVICTQVLEHVHDPGIVLQEIFRVLKTNGELWLTAPLYYEEHESPNDYFRFTRYGISYLIETAGFEIKKIEWLEGYFGTLSYELRKAAKNLPLDPRKLGNPLSGILLAILNLFLKPTFMILSIIFSHADIMYKYQASGNCKNYAAIAVKIDRV